MMTQNNAHIYLDTTGYYRHIMRHYL